MRHFLYKLQSSNKDLEETNEHIFIIFGHAPHGRRSEKTQNELLKEASQGKRKRKKDKARVNS